MAKRSSTAKRSSNAKNYKHRRSTKNRTWKRIGGHVPKPRTIYTHRRPRSTHLRSVSTPRRRRSTLRRRRSTPWRPRSTPRTPLFTPLRPVSTHSQPISHAKYLTEDEIDYVLSSVAINATEEQKENLRLFFETYELNEDYDYEYERNSTNNNVVLGQALDIIQHWNREGDRVLRVE